MRPRNQLFDQPAFLPPVEDLTAFIGQRIAITGHRGTLGGVLLSRCRTSAVEVSTFEGDVLNSGAVDSWISGIRPTLVFHFAAVVPVEHVERDPVRAYAVNTIGSLNVASAVIRHTPGAWLFMASTSHVYSPLAPTSAGALNEDSRLAPSTFYGVTKLAAEHLITPLLSHMKNSWCIGRIFSFGHRTQEPPYLVPSLIAQIRSLPEGDALPLRCPGSVRDILDAETVIDAILHLARSRYEGVINIGSGKGVTVADIALALAKRLERTVTIACESDEGENSLVANVSRLRHAIRSAE